MNMTLQSTTSSSTLLSLSPSLSQINTNSTSKLNQFLSNKLNKIKIDNSTEDIKISSPKSGGFKLPNLKGNLSNSNLSLSTNKNLKAVNLSNVLYGKKSENEIMSEQQQQNQVENIQKSKIINNSFCIPFINCDIIQNNNQTDLSHIIDINEHENFMKMIKSNLFGEPSNFAKIIKLKYKCKSMPYIKHKFITKYQPEPFKFDSKSPDDIHLEWKGLVSKSSKIIPS